MKERMQGVDWGRLLGYWVTGISVVLGVGILLLIWEGGIFWVVLGLAIVALFIGWFIQEVIL